MLDEKIEKVCDVSLILMVRGFLGKSLKAKVCLGFYVYTRLGYVYSACDVKFIITVCM